MLAMQGCSPHLLLPHTSLTCALPPRLSPLLPPPLACPRTSPRESPSSDSEDDSWTLEEGRERPCRGDADGVFDSSSLSTPGTCSFAEGQRTQEALRGPALPAVSPQVSRACRWGGPRPGARSWPSLELTPSSASLTLCDLGRHHFCDLRSELLQELLRAHLSQGQMATGLCCQDLCWGQTLAQSAVCATDVPEHMHPGHPGLGVRGADAHTELSQHCQKQDILTMTGVSLAQRHLSQGVI